MFSDWKRRTVTFLKGMVMGTSDVIPGVSGGTMALILGIYERLVGAIERINLDWFRKLFDLVVGPDGDQRRRDLIRDLQLPFLVPLGAGILSAIVLGSQFIPGLLSNYPEIIRGFFFGLILASLWIPLDHVSTTSVGQVLMVVVILVGGTFLGYYVTDPSRRLLPDKTWVTVESGGEQFEDILRRGASSLPAYKAFWSKQNRSFRQFLKRNRPELYQRLRQNRETRLSGEAGSRKEVLKARSKPYKQITVPEGITVRVPRLRLGFTFFAGFTAICAMILPGISGSYILLIFGAYFFVLNILKGFLAGLLQFQFLGLHALYLSLFVTGTVAGLGVFSRLLGYLLDHWKSLTMALLSGLMAGCLRGVWPFRQVTENTIVNVGPPGFSNLTIAVTISVLVGVGVMVSLFLFGAVYAEEDDEQTL